MYDGDGFPDLAVANPERDGVLLFRQRYLTHHANQRIDVPDDRATPTVLIDPRSPPRYRLQLPVGVEFEPESSASPGQVCILPAPVFPLPRRELPATDVSTNLEVITDAVTILREDSRIDSPALLTLRIRKPSEDSLVDTARTGSLHVFRKDPVTGHGTRLETYGAPEVVEFGGGKAVSFPVDCFGTYLVALE